MNTKRISLLIAILLVGSLAQSASAQTSPEPTPPQRQQPADEEAAEDDATDDDEDGAPDAEAGEEPSPADDAEIENDEVEDDELEDAEVEDDGEFEDEDDAPVFGDDFGDSPISDLAGDDIEFVPLEDIEEGVLEQITPVDFYPHLEIDGWFRVRSRFKSNFDLGTGGTSAVLPPLESFTPAGQPADAEAGSLWTTDMRLFLEPVFHITETLRVQVEADVLRNVVLGSRPQFNLFDTRPPHPDRRLGTSGQHGRLADALVINEAFGEVDAFFGTIRAGRMDNHWGLGIFANGGDCFDCDFGDSIDRVMYRTRLWYDFYGIAAIDFPDEGLSSPTSAFWHGRPYDLSQRDEINQFTFALVRMPITRQDHEIQAQRLYSERSAVFNGGAYFSYRTRNGQFVGADTAEPIDVADPPQLIYRGEQLYIADLWFQMLYAPAVNRSMRVELEAVGIFGSVDNATNLPVGLGNDGDGGVNCLDSAVADANPALCSAPDDSGNTVTQFGVALETEFDVGAPVGFGVNAGFATGGDAPNWGYGAQNPDLAFYRFSPDYHVDLILFREVIGTVTNAYYVNPYVTASFLEVGNRRMELQVDGILSRAFDEAGTPGDSAWLGLEFDASLRFVLRDTFLASIDGGLLFPFEGLGAVADRERLTVFGNQPDTFRDPLSPELAWTLQGRLVWSF